MTSKMPSCPDEKEPPKRAPFEERLVNADQRSLMLDFLKSHNVPILQDNVDPILWTVLVQKLNAVPGGLRYTSDEWREDFQANARLQQSGADVPQNGDVERLPKRGNGGTIWRIVEEPRAIQMTSKMPSCPDEKEPPKRAPFEERLVNADQRSLMLDFLKSHNVPILQDNVDPILWTVLVQKLNAVPGGLRYTSDEWREDFQANARLQQSGADVPQNGDVERLPKRGNGGTIWRIVEEPSKITSDKDSEQQVVGSVAKVAKDSLHLQNQAPASSGTATMEQILMKKLIKSDSIKIRYLKRKLKMEGQFRKNKLSLMRDMLLVKQRKVKVEEKQATALLRIARSLDKLLQSRRLEQF